MRPGFEWEQDKADANLKKHRISFDEAATVFLDPFSITMPDPDHSIGEQRYVDVGSSERQRVLVVAYTQRGMNVRIISCRRATPSERRAYEEGHT